MRFPFLLASSCFVVLDDATHRDAASVLDGWRDGMNRIAGPPMFCPPPLLLEGPSDLPALIELQRTTIRAALEAGVPVTLAGGPWRAISHAGKASFEMFDSASRAVFELHRPDLHVVFPAPDGGHPSALRRAAEENTDLLLLRAGGRATLSLQIFDAMVRRGLYASAA